LVGEHRVPGFAIVRGEKVKEKPETLFEGG
jgi:hypothetical protein